MGIEDHKLFHPVTDDVRQVDNFGGYTAAAGGELMTAHNFPADYCDQASLVCEPTGHLVHLDWLVPQGSGFVAHDGFNLLASSDAWTAPIAAQVGPDGAVWVLDWYTPVVQHNPTPHGFQDRRQARRMSRRCAIRRTGESIGSSPTDSKRRFIRNSTRTIRESLLQALGNENLFWRLQAQRLLVERGKTDVLKQLADMVTSQAEQQLVPSSAAPRPGAAVRAPDRTGYAALHALRTMQGLGAFTANSGGKWDEVLVAGLAHPAAGVRRSALACLPHTPASVEKILAARSLFDGEPLVRKDALLALSEMPATPAGEAAVLSMFAEPRNYADRWIPIAVVTAAAKGDVAFLTAAAGAKTDAKFAPQLGEVVRIVAEHFARRSVTRARRRHPYCARRRRSGRR